MDLKALIQYLLNHLKFWVVVPEWDSAVHLRFGKIKRSVSGGIFIRLPIIDKYFSHPNREQEATVDQINAVTFDGKDVTISASIRYVVHDIEQMFVAYSEPNQIVATMLKRCIVDVVSLLPHDKIYSNTLSKELTCNIGEVVGIKITWCGVTTFSNARVYRIIKDSSYAYKGDNDIKQELI